MDFLNDIIIFIAGDWNFYFYEIVNGILGVVCILLFLSIMCSFFASTQSKLEEKNRTKLFNHTILTTTLFCIFVSILMYSFCFVISEAHYKGISKEQTQEMTVREIIEINKTINFPVYPQETKVDFLLSYQTTQANNIIIMYKYGCPDCEAIYDELEQYLKDNGIKNVIYVPSSRTKDLIDEYGITNVPAGIYEFNTPLSNGTTGICRQLSTQNENGDTVLDSNNLEKLVEAQAREMKQS